MQDGWKGTARRKIYYQSKWFTYLNLVGIFGWNLMRGCAKTVAENAFAASTGWKKKFWYNDTVCVCVSEYDESLYDARFNFTGCVWGSRQSLHRNKIAKKSFPLTISYLWTLSCWLRERASGWNWDEKIERGRERESYLCLDRTKRNGTK